MDVSTTRVRLVHWKDSEAKSKLSELEAAGYLVDYEPLRNQAAMRRIQESKPKAIVIDLSRQPSQGRDLAIWLRIQKSTREIPLVFLGGTRKRIDSVQRVLPDAVYAEWTGAHDAIERAIADPPKKPVVPDSVFAGYSGTPLPKKLGIKAGYVVATVGSPPDFDKTLGTLPGGAVLRPSGRGRRHLTICFLRSTQELRRRIDGLVKASHQGHVWIAWPKKASGMSTDLTQAEVRKAGLAAGLVDFKICAIDETWSGLCFALRR